MANRSKPHLHHSGAWRTRINGKEIWLGSDEAEAHRRFANLIARTPATTRRKPIVIAEIVERYKANADAWTARQLVDFIVWIGARSCERPLETLDAYVAVLRKKGNQPKTIRHKVSAAMAALRWGVKQKWIASVPEFPKLKKAPRVARDIPPKLLAAVLLTVPPRARAILAFIAETGCRPSEACGLKWSMRRGDTFVLPQHKESGKGQTRTIYLTAAAKAIIDARPTESVYVFLSRLGKPYTATGLHSILRRRGITGAYALRHTFAQVASERVAIDVLAKLMGHADASTTARHYYQVRDARAIAGAQSLDAIAPLDMPAPGLPTIAVRDDRRPAGTKRVRRTRSISDASETQNRPVASESPAPHAETPERLHIA